MRIRFDANVLGWVVQHMNCELKKLCNNIGSRKIKITTLVLDKREFPCLRLPSGPASFSAEYPVRVVKPVTS
jgi:hypothetical protein